MGAQQRPIFVPRKIIFFTIILSSVPKKTHMMEADTDSNPNVRSELDHAGRLLNNVIDQLHTPEKDGRSSISSSSLKMSDGGRSGGRTPSSQQRREAEEFPWSHDVYSLGKEPSPRRKKKTSAGHTRGLWHLLMTLVVGVLYGVVIASSGCMMVAHVGLLDRVVPPQGWERFSKATDMYRAHMAPVLEAYVVPYARVAHEEVCTRRVHPYIMRVRDVTTSSVKDIASAVERIVADIKEKMRSSAPNLALKPSSSSSTSLVALVPSDGRKKSSGSELLQFIQKKFATIGQNMVFWGRPMRTEDASPDAIAMFLQRHVIPQSVMNVTPAWVLYSIIQPLAVFISTVGGLSLALVVLALVMKKTEQD